MNTSFSLDMKNGFFNSDKKPFRKNIDTVKPKFICIIFIAFASLFVAGCNGNNSSTDNKNKTDTVFVQPNNQSGEHEGEGMGDDRRGMDTTHRGMDSMNHKRHQ